MPRSPTQDSSPTMTAPELSMMLVTFQFGTDMGQTETRMRGVPSGHAPEELEILTSSSSQILCTDSVKRAGSS